MSPILIVTFLLLYMVLEFLASFFFNIKLKMISKKKYNNAAFLGAISTTIFTFLTALASLVGTIGGNDGTMWWFIFAAAGMMTVGNIIASLSIEPFNKWWTNRESAKGVDA